MKKERRINIGEIKGKRRTKSEFTGKQVCTSEDKPAELCGFNFHRSLLVSLLSL